MDPERWLELSPLLDALLEMDPATRARHLEQLRTEQPALGEELARLLALEGTRDDFLSEPLIAPLPGPRIGGRVGPYRLERMLGEGGMGQVWLASRADGLYQRRVALKLLRPGLADTNLQLRFSRERQILARLTHPHIAHLLDAGTSRDGQPYLALEYVEGVPITDWCRQQSASLEARLRLFLQTCDAVSHAHANLIVHRDLKPSNILVSANEEVQLLDFGIAKLLDGDGVAEGTVERTGTGVRAFTLHYAAPEQLRSEPVTTMTDVYALGVVLYELLTGTRPYRLEGSTDAEWERAILEAEPLRPSLAAAAQLEAEGKDSGLPRNQPRALRGDLDNIVHRALAKQPERRYPSVEALALDILRYRDGKPVAARRRGLGYLVGKFIRRNRWSLGTGVLALLVLSASLGIVAWQAQQAVREASRAQALQDFVVGLFEHAGVQGGEALDVRELLEAGLRRGDQALARQPAARAELMGVVARLRMGLGDYAQALALLDRQQQLVDGLGDRVPTSLRLEAATNRGRVQWLMGRPRACTATMSPLLRVVYREQRQLPTQAADFWSQLGRCLRSTGEGEAARPMFQRALAMRRDVLRDQAGVVESLADLAGLQADAGHMAQAGAGYREALRQLRSGIGTQHPLAVQLLRRLCALQREAGDSIQAERDCAHALELARELHGEGHPATVAARRQLAVVEVDIGRYADAAANLREVRAWTMSRGGPAHPDVAADDIALARVAWEIGEPERALQATARAIGALRRQEAPLLLAEALYQRARMLHGMGRGLEARPLAVEARELRIAAFGTAAGMIGDSQRLLGEIDAGLGDGARALAELEAALHTTRVADGPDHPRTRLAELALARYQLESGDAAALARLDALAGLASREIRTRRVGWLAAAAAARHRCGSGDDRLRTHTLAGLRTLRAQVRNAQPEGGLVERVVANTYAACM
ncbi:serine/threonine-protein kinase [Cognatiluteimonas lumbrici]|uniref:serine/threonine-protein kinase n=1 Tax=Cognatiluteimonas lumbrici TaxID=2559601 RepID=UPI00112B5CAC|nr:serine/threonine-protein kinase [Luteimonas lumbrici]